MVANLPFLNGATTSGLPPNNVVRLKSWPASPEKYCRYGYRQTDSPYRQRMDKYVIVFVNGAGFRFKRAGEELIKASIMLWFLMQRF